MTSVGHFLLLYCICWIAGSGRILAQGIDSVIAKDTITILITDSGLGGLSVCAKVEKKCRELKSFRVANILFCNALAEKNYGYNSMKTKGEKLEVFSLALDGMTRAYSPDIILIACNTLSVLYAETDYAKSAKIPVISIVDIGVDMIMEELLKDSTNAVLIFGTPTTIAANKHKERLMERGIAERRIVTQACRSLESEIQENPASNATKEMVEQYSSEALKKLTTRPLTVIAGLCCTHYGYSRDEFSRSLGSKVEDLVLVNPNERMSDFLFQHKYRFAQTDVAVQVVSRVEITSQEITSLGGLLAKDSPATAEAMKHYILKRDLFHFVPKN